MGWVQAAVLDWLQTQGESKDDDGLSVLTLRSAGEDEQLAGLWTQRKRIELDGWAAAASGTDGLFSGLFLLKLHLLAERPCLTPSELSSTRTQQAEPLSCHSRGKVVYI